MPGIGRGSDFAGAVKEKSKHSKGTLRHGTCDQRTNIYLISINYIQQYPVYLYVYLSV